MGVQKPSKNNAIKVSKNRSTKQDKQGPEPQSARAGAVETHFCIFFPRFLDALGSPYPCDQARVGDGGGTPLIMSNEAHSLSSLKGPPRPSPYSLKGSFREPAAGVRGSRLCPRPHFLEVPGKSKNLKIILPEHPTCDNLFKKNRCKRLASRHVILAAVKC